MLAFASFLGLKAAEQWCKIFPDKALIWLPTAKKDLTDMWSQKQDLRLWTSLALACLSCPPLEVAEPHRNSDPSLPTSTSEPRRDSGSSLSALNQTRRDSGSSLSDPLATQNVRHLCYKCSQEDLETPGRFSGPDGTRYCRKHYDELPSDVRKAAIEKLAERCRQEFPGWRVTVEPHDPHAKPHAPGKQAPKTLPDYWT